MTWDTIAAERIAFFAGIEGGDRLEDGAVLYTIERYRLELEEPPELARMARELGTTRRSLRRQFKRATGRSTRSYRAQLRTIRARVMLVLCPEVTLEQLAERLGYADSQNLGQAIKEQLGLGARQLRDAPICLLAVIDAHRKWVESFWELGAGSWELGAGEGYHGHRHWRDAKSAMVGGLAPVITHTRPDPAPAPAMPPAC